MRVESVDPKATRLLLAVTGIESLVLFGASLGLLFQPTAIGAIWPWPLTPFNAAFLGAIYAASFVSTAALVVIGRWSPARIVTPMILVFTAIVLLVSLFYLGRFRTGWSTWLWFFLYLALPLNAAWHVWLYRKAPPAPEEPPRLGPALRDLVSMMAAGLGAYGVVMLILPDVATLFWPWPVDDFHARLYSVTFLTPALGLVLLVRAAAWAELWAMGLTLIVLGALALLGLVAADFGTGRVDWTAPGTWLYGLLFVLIVLAGLALCRSGRRRRRAPGPLAADGLRIAPRWLALVFGVAFVAAGVAGFLPVFTRAIPAEAPSLHVDAAYGLLIGLYPVNAVHSAFHLIVGLLGLAAFARPSWALTYVRAFAIALAALTVLGLAPGLDTVFGLAPLFGHDVWLHGIEALAAAYVGWVMTPVKATGRSPEV